MTKPALTILPGKPSDWDRGVALAAQRALAGRAGAVVAMDPRTGRVLTVVNPDYGLWHAYQPCSVFKIVVALAGLTEGVITPEMRLPCTHGCWKRGGHGPINLREALAVSCNSYFEQVGELLGYERLQKYARQLALGEISGINLTGEVPGSLPAMCAPEAVGRLSSYADGITTTAVQIGVMLSAVVNGGIVFQPQIAGASDFVAKERWRLPQGTVLAGLAEGFLGAVNEGTAVSAFDPDVAIAGKTGSCLHSGWFASYAPAGGPELLLVVHLRSGNGHRAAAVAGRIYQALYKPTAGAPAVGGGR
jgi:penicillin-binding protein 2